LYLRAGVLRVIDWKDAAAEVSKDRYKRKGRPAAVRVRTGNYHLQKEEARTRIRGRVRPEEASKEKGNLGKNDRLMRREGKPYSYAFLLALLTFPLGVTRNVDRRGEGITGHNIKREKGGT